MLVIPLGKWKQEDQKSKVILSYIVSWAIGKPVFKKKSSRGNLGAGVHICRHSYSRS